MEINKNRKEDRFENKTEPFQRSFDAGIRKERERILNLIKTKRIWRTRELKELIKES